MAIFGGVLRLTPPGFWVVFRLTPPRFRLGFRLTLRRFPRGWTRGERSGGAGSERIEIFFSLQS